MNVGFVIEILLFTDVPYRAQWPAARNLISHDLTYRKSLSTVDRPNRLF